MPYFVDPLTRKDVDIILNWHREHVKINFPDSKYKKELFRKILLTDLRAMERDIRKDISLLKMSEGKKIVGFLWLKKVFDPYKEKNYCDLHYIHVAPEYRGKGIGGQLMNIADVWCEKKKIKEIRLGTSVNNFGAYNLYKNHGFETKRLLMEKQCQLTKK